MSDLKPPPADDFAANSDRPLGPIPAALSGACMGAADAIPGVSGGTIALVLGIYEEFIAALSALIKWPLRPRDPGACAAARAALALLIPLGFGLGVAYLLVARLLVGKPDHPGFVLAPSTAPLAYAFFFGLVLASINEPLRRIRRHSALTIALIAVGTAAAVLFSGLDYQRGEPPVAARFFGGAGAISVMLLPGVSGSLLLVILGQYQSVVTAVNTLDVLGLLPTLLGILFGLITFVPLLRLALKRAHDATMALLTGFLIGSLRAVWPWKDNYDMKAAPMNEVWPESFSVGVLIAAVLGAVVISLLTRLEARLRRRHTLSGPAE